MNNGYRDNYPHNIEAPQRVYVQYSQDIPDFDYSNGKYPLGEDYESFIWENVYIPVPHQYGDLELGRHVWMRWRIGEKDSWTIPMRFTDSFLNIETTELEEIVGTEQVRFRFKYTLNSGEIIYSEYLTLTNGIDGISIINSEIIGTDLHITYSNGTSDNVGRVVGYDGLGFPSAGSDIPGNIAVVDPAQNILWTQFDKVVDDLISFTLPIEYNTDTISHSDIDGYRHIPIGGSINQVLATDGVGNYTWQTRMPYSAIDDLATTGDLDKVYSADHITALIAGLSLFGIKYSEETKVLLDTIIGIDDELGVVTNDPLWPNRTVFKWSGGPTGNWGTGFFDLDATHNHDDRYYTKIELNTSGAGGEVHWNNVTNKPTVFFKDFTITGDSGSVLIEDGDNITFNGQNGLAFSISGNTINLNGYVEGSGIDMTGNSIAHSNTSSVANTVNLNGTVLQNLTFDTYGHILTRSSINLDTRYSLLSHTHSRLTPGDGINGSSYDGSVARTFNIAYAGSGGDYGTTNEVARANHTHSGDFGYASHNTFGLIGATSNECVALKYGNANWDIISLEIKGAYSPGKYIGDYTLLATLPSASYYPLVNTTGTLRIIRQGDGVVFTFNVLITTAGQITSELENVTAIDLAGHITYHRQKF